LDKPSKRQKDRRKETDLVTASSKLKVVAEPTNTTVVGLKVKLSGLTILTVPSFETTAGMGSFAENPEKGGVGVWREAGMIAPLNIAETPFAETMFE
jgi:hypothetical protein